MLAVAAEAELGLDEARCLGALRVRARERQEEGEMAAPRAVAGEEVGFAGGRPSRRAL